MKKEDLTGHNFGRLTAIASYEDHIQRSGRHKTQWLCRCSCGNEVVVQTFNLKSGNTKSCGCLNAENIKTQSVTHGDRHTRLYRIWCGMKSRCYDTACPSYERYGRRGIMMCDEWKESYQTFKDWAVQRGYNDELSIDRVNNDEGYSPENCRWATQKEQANNRSSFKHFLYEGRDVTISELSEITGIKYHTLFARLNTLHWTVDDAVKTPVRTTT